jgi:hypothetical protein
MVPNTGGSTAEHCFYQGMDGDFDGVGTQAVDAFGWTTGAG